MNAAIKGAPPAARSIEISPPRMRRASMVSDAWPVCCLIFRDAGAREVELRARRDDRVAEIAGGGSIFIESEITVTALGRPRLGGGAAMA